MMDLRSIARALGGEVLGRQVLCPGPGHSPKDRSLSVRLEPTAPDGILVHSYAGDDWRACRDHVLAYVGISLERNQVARAGVTAYACVGRSNSDEAQRERALAIWDDSQDPRGTVVERYLERRGLELPPKRPAGRSG